MLLADVDTLYSSIHVSELLLSPDNTDFSIDIIDNTQHKDENSDYTIHNIDNTQENNDDDKIDIDHKSDTVGRDSESKDNGR